MPENKNNIVRTSIRMNGELHEKLSDYVHALRKLDKRKSIDWAVQEAIRDWLDISNVKETNSRKSVQKGTSISGEIEQATSATSHQQWLSMLVEVLGSGHSVAIDAVLRNLVAFHELVSRAKGDKTSDPSSFPKSPDVTRAIEDFYRHEKQLADTKTGVRKRGARNAG
jgi:hypothetical protein